MNYKELSKGLSPEELEKYSQGIALMGNMADSLQRQRLLPKRFTQPVENITTQAEQAFYAIPEGLGIRSTLEIGGKSTQQLEEELKQRGINVSGYALDMMHSPAFTTLEESTPIELLKVRVADLGLSGTPTTKQIFERAQRSRVGEMVLDLCPSEVGPYQRLHDSEQALNDWYYIAHQQITDRDGYPGVFGLGRCADGLWLDGGWARPENRWSPGDQLVFALRNIEPVKA